MTKFDRNPKIQSGCKKIKMFNSTFLHLNSRIYNVKTCSTFCGNAKTTESLPCSIATLTLISIGTIEITIQDWRSVRDDLKNVSITRLKQPIRLFTVPFTHGCEVTRILKWD